MPGKVLVIAGSDSGGGAGIQADIKTITLLGSYVSTAITALTAQNTQGVFAIHNIPEEFIKRQIEVVLDDIGADIIKTGMLANKGVIDIVAESIKTHAPSVRLVVDPVMAAKGGEKLLEDDAVNSLKKRLIPMSYLVTPNIPEAEIICGINIKTVDDMANAGKIITEQLGANSALIKGGHLTGDIINDVLVRKSEVKIWKNERIESRNTHGTGCTLASAISAFLANDVTLEESVNKAREYVRKAIKTATGIGKGNGPLNHACTAVINSV